VVVCGVSSRSGRARRTRQPERSLRSFTHLESPFSDSDRRPGQGAINRSVLSWAFFPSRACSSNPWVRSARGPMKSGRTRASPVFETQAPDHAFSSGLWIRPWGLEPTVRRRLQSIEPEDVTVRQRTCLRAVSSPAHPPFTSPAFELAREPEGPSLTRTRDVLPAPPLGGAPRLRPFARLPPLGGTRVDLGDTGFGLLVGRPLAGPAISSGVLPLVEPSRWFEWTRHAA